MNVTIEIIFNTFRSYLSLLMPFLMTLATVIFIWGVVKFTAYSGNVEKRKSAKDLIIYGLIGLFILVSFWGIVKLFQDSLNFPETPPANWPPKVYP